MHVCQLQMLRSFLCLTVFQLCFHTACSDQKPSIPLSGSSSDNQNIAGLSTNQSSPIFHGKNLPVNHPRGHLFHPWLNVTDHAGVGQAEGARTLLKLDSSIKADPADGWENVSAPAAHLPLNRTGRASGFRAGSSSVHFRRLLAIGATRESTRLNGIAGRAGQSEDRREGADGISSASQVAKEYPWDPDSNDSTLEYTHVGLTKFDWRTKFVIDQTPRPALLEEECRDVAPYFSRDVRSAMDGIPPIKTIEDLQALQEGQRVMVVVPRFGLGNTLRNLVSSMVYALLAGRRVVLLHAGLHFGVFDSLCRAFRCRGTDHIRWHGPELDPRELAHRFRTLSFVKAVGAKGARNSLWHEDAVLFSYNHAFWDTWWLGNKPLRKCLHQLLDCSYENCVRSRMIYTLLGAGPSRALNRVIEEVVVGHLAPRERLQLSGPAGERLLAPKRGMALSFDVALHIRTRAAAVERPRQRSARQCWMGGCQDEDATKQMHRYLNSKVWKCIHSFLSLAAHGKIWGLEGPEEGRALTIFLATDNEALRPKFVELLEPFGSVYYNRAHVAHVGVALPDDPGRLPTMAEFFLLAKAKVSVELDQYLSTFLQFAGLLGNGTLVVLPKHGRHCKHNIVTKGKRDFHLLWDLFD